MTHVMSVFSCTFASCSPSLIGASYDLSYLRFKPLSFESIQRSNFDDGCGDWLVLKGEAMLSIDAICSCLLFGRAIEEVGYLIWVEMARRNWKSGFDLLSCWWCDVSCNISCLLQIMTSCGCGRQSGSTLYLAGQQKALRVRERA